MLCSGKFFDIKLYKLPSRKSGQSTKRHEKINIKKNSRRNLRQLDKDTDTDIEAELNESYIDVSIKTNDPAGTNSIVLNS